MDYDHLDPEGSLMDVRRISSSYFLKRCNTLWLSDSSCLLFTLYLCLSFIEDSSPDSAATVRRIEQKG